MQGRRAVGIKGFLTFLTLRSHGKQNHSRQTGHQRAHRGSARLNRAHMVELVRQCAALHRHGHRVVLVTSGAIAAGREHLGHPPLAPTLPNKQMLAAVGQTQLIRVWQDLFNLYGLHIGQMLLTRADWKTGSATSMPATPCAPCSITASSPSSTRTTPWPLPRSRWGTTTTSPPVPPSWRMRTC